MKIAIPTLGCDGGLSGISRYTTNIIEQLARASTVDQVRIFSLEGEERHFDRSPGHERTVTVPARFANPLASILWHQLPFARAARGADVWFLPAGNRRLPLYAPCPTVGVVHDLSSLHVPGKYGASRDVYIRHVLPALVRRLSHVITISESSRRDIVEHCHVPGERVTVIPLGVDPDAFSPGDVAHARQTVRERLGVAAPYFLYVSRIEHPGKNHIRLIEAFARTIAATGAPHHLVLAGPDRERAEEVHAFARSSVVCDRIHFTGFLPDELLPQLYRASTALVFPSLYEGFGLPLVEAMACGVPVACARASSLPEVAGDAALYFDPLCVHDLQSRLTELTRNAGLCERLAEMSLARSRMFRWDEVGRRTLEVLRSVRPRLSSRAA